MNKILAQLFKKSPNSSIHPKKLKELGATAICGNDISSSVLYVSALAIVFAGQYAWITLLIVAFVLYLFRKIYGEVVGALPLNGGAYNALLNTTSKQMASLAATLTLLSYMATAVISGNEAIHYLSRLIPYLQGSWFQPHDIVIYVTILLLAVFAGLTIMGISESSKVAIGIFIFHLTSMTILIGSILYYLMVNGFGMFYENWNSVLSGGSVAMAIFFGFSVSMLGISGFESSANFVEEQERGVFPKTLRNMWIVVSILNPLMAFLALSLFPIPLIKESYETTLLSQMGETSSGVWLATLVSIDAFLVLSGAVLTSYVGVSGLLERMTLDRILPQFFLKKNNKNSPYRIILLFFLLGVSVLYITKGKVSVLAGVYTISFLSVMGLFVIGNVLLKVKRAKLPRPEHASWIGIILAFAGVTIALLGNIMMKPEIEGESSNFTIFLNYFIPAIIFVFIMLNRISLLNVLLKTVMYFFNPIRRFVINMNKRTNEMIDRINSQEFVFFTKGDNIANLNRVMFYIRNNEHTKNIKIVTVLEKEMKLPEHFESDMEVLDREFPEIEVEFIKMEGKFTPSLIRKLSKQWDIPINFMFIGSPGDHFPYRVEDLGGVRLII